MREKIFKYPIELAFILIVIIVLSLGLIISYHIKEDYSCPSREIFDVKCAKLTQSNDLNRTCYPHFNDYRERLYCSEGWVVYNYENGELDLNNISTP